MGESASEPRWLSSSGSWPRSMDDAVSPARRAIAKRNGGRAMNEINAPSWRKSSRCGTSSCVEVARVGGRFLVRDSKNPHGAVLTFTEEEWAAFVEGVAAGEFRP